MAPVSRLLIGLVLAEAVLFCASGSGQVPWLREPGWPSLYCIALAAIGLALSAGVLAAQWLVRRKLQFNLLALVLVVLAVAVPCGWFTAEMRRAAGQRATVAAVRSAGGSVLYDFHFADDEEPVMFSGVRPGETWLHRWLGDDFFHELAGAQARTDAALAPLAGCTSLRHLMFDNSEVTDQGLLALGPLPRLEWLDLRDAPKVTGPGLKPLADSPRLRVLMLRRTGVGDEAMQHLRGLSRLEMLDLGMTKVTGAGLAPLASFTNLRELHFWGNAIDDASLAHLKHLTQLEQLDLGGAKLTDSGLARLAHLARLQMLGLRGASITDACLAHLADLGELRQLDLFNTKITDAGLAQLAELTRLESLNIGQTQVTVQRAEMLQRKLPSCRIQR